MYSSTCVQTSPDSVLEASLKIEPPECAHNQNFPVTNTNNAPKPLLTSKSNKTLETLTNIYRNLQLNQQYSLNLNLGLGRSDNKLAYKLFDNIIVGERYIELTEAYKTSLAAQSSLDKIASLIESSLYWGGPISLAVFAGTEKELNHLLLYILYLRKCNTRIKEKVSFHLAIPKEKGPKTYVIDEERLEKMDCGNPMGVLHGLLKELTKRGIHAWKYKIPYPQNLLRNLARKNCHTKFLFLTDVDIIPSRGMAEHLNAFLESEKCDGKCAYVVPTYELDERVLFPPNKTDLIRMANKGLARPFHHKVFIYNQYATNFNGKTTQIQTIK
ncbi:unnamed protein product [Ceutorhynchus assimilis]|uniref:Beta-1,4-glucuronyltransferase 1 n=1 Tax=Ceutorhynchus assimilis TaxID=467358 RepID=A0A9P0DIN8_9CUCU|nr:unnamed protein product [Ceutorhynchus assimilis]